MCFFPQNPQTYNEQLVKYNITYECGACPECLAKRSRRWALRCAMELKYSTACMITLTYDTYIRDEHGNIIGEQVADRSVDKRDAQLFIKRLRRSLELPHISQARAKINHFLNQSYRKSRMRISKRLYKKQMRARYAEEIKKYIKEYVSQRAQKIKYLLTAEYGKRTHRPHYHALLFNYEFPDLLKYKKSKRGNQIYKSHTLERIWNQGICTVDAKVASAKIARYCTKYCAKDSRADDTFMLVSRDIGTRALLEEFNGISYFVDGREYPIPKLIWNKIILQRYDYRYKNIRQHFTTRYAPPILRDKDNDDWQLNPLFKPFLYGRRAFQRCRDKDKQYQKYIEYWQKKNAEVERTRPDAFTRVLQLPNEKYFSYKQAALKVLAKNSRDLSRFSARLMKGDIFNLPPRSNCFGRYERYIESLSKNARVTCFSPSCHNKTSDTQKPILFPIDLPGDPFALQLSMFDDSSSPNK